MQCDLQEFYEVNNEWKQQGSLALLPMVQDKQHLLTNQDLKKNLNSSLFFEQAAIRFSWPRATFC